MQTIRGKVNQNTAEEVDYSDAPSPELLREAAGDPELLHYIGQREHAANELVRSSDTDVGSNAALKGTLDMARELVAARKTELGVDEKGTPPNPDNRPI